jgi:hypothetical protein
VAHPAPTLHAAAHAHFGLPPGVAAVYTKEWRYLTRDPVYKAMAVQMVYLLAVFGISFFTFPHGSQNPLMDAHGPGVYFREVMPFFMTAVMPTAFMRLVFNIFGGEGGAVSILLSFPTPRRQILAGKNLAHAVVLVPMLMAIMVGACLVFRVPRMIGLGVLWVLIEAATMLGIGVVVSVLLPNRIFVRGMVYQGGGCAYVLLQMLAGGIGLAMLAVPAAMIALSVWLASDIWSAVLLPLAVLYAGAVYVGGLAIAESLIDRQTTTIIARLSPTE